MTPTPDDIQPDEIDRLEQAGEVREPADRQQKALDDDCHRCGHSLRPTSGEIGGGYWQATYGICPTCRATGAASVAFITIGDGNLPQQTDKRLERQRNKSPMQPQTIAAHLAMAPPGDYEVRQAGSFTWVVIPDDDVDDDDVLRCYPSDQWATNATKRSDGIVVYPTDIELHDAPEN